MVIKNEACRLVWVAICALATSPLCGCGGGRGDAAAAGHRHGNGGPDRESISVRVAPVTRESISAGYSTSATLRADKRATVIARTRGVIERLAVEEGARVAAGEPLAFLEDDEQQIATDRARTTFDTRTREAERLQGLLDRGLVSEDEFERARRDAEDARHALELAELELSRTVIRAPIEGVILERFLDLGATVADGTEVYSIADLDPLYADINVPERHVARLQSGQIVRLTADASGESVDATIERISPMVYAATGTVKVTVVVSSTANLRPGAFARVDIITDTHDWALVVPRSALVAEGRRWNLFRLSDDRATVSQIQVELGFENGDRVELAGVVGAEEALEPGVEVVVAGAPALSDGAEVLVVDEASDDATDAPVESTDAA